MYFAREGAIVITNNRSPMKNVEPPQELSREEQAAWLSMVGDAETAAKEIRAFGGQAEAMFCDVANYDAVGQMMEKSLKNTAGSILWSTTPPLRNPALCFP